MGAYVDCPNPAGAQMTPKRIDSHQRFWRLDRGIFGWLTPDMVAINRDFEPADLEPALRKHCIGGTVLVQAAPSLAETEFMLGNTGDNDFVAGWVAIYAPNTVGRLTDV